MLGFVPAVVLKIPEYIFLGDAPRYKSPRVSIINLSQPPYCAIFQNEDRIHVSGTISISRMHC